MGSRDSTPTLNVLNGLDIAKHVFQVHGAEELGLSVRIPNAGMLWLNSADKGLLHQRCSLTCQGTPGSSPENSEVQSSGRRCAKLFQGTQTIPSGPVFDDLAAGDTEDENLGCAQQLAGRR